VIERVADEAFQIRAVVLQTLRPGNGAQEFFFFLESLPSPRESRLVWVGAELRQSFLASPNAVNKRAAAEQFSARRPCKR